MRAIFEDRKIQSPAVGQQRLQAWLEQVEAFGYQGLLCASLQDREKLARQDRQLFSQSGEQRSYRRLESWAARRHLACLWNGELSEFPPACPALLWPWFGLIIPQTSRRAKILNHREEFRGCAARPPASPSLPSYSDICLLAKPQHHDTKELKYTIAFVAIYGLYDLTAPSADTKFRHKAFGNKCLHE